MNENKSTSAETVKFPVAKKGGRKLVKKPKKTEQVDWEKLAKDLQAALAKEIKENETLIDSLHRFTGIEHHVDYLEDEIEKHKRMMLEQRGVIGYLESKLKTILDEINGSNSI